LESEQRSDEQSIINISPSKNSNPELNFDQHHIARIETVNTPFGTFDVPVPHKQHVKEWTQVLERHNLVLNERIQKIKEFENQNFNIIGTIKQHVSKVNFKTREGYKIKVLQHCLMTLITERVLSRRIDEIADQFTEAMGEPDPAFDGLWLTTDQERSQQFLDKIGTCSIPTKRKYKFDAKSTEYLVEMLFSKDIEVRAKAKLNLSARLEASIHREVILVSEV
jgi:hypothetical protein